MAIQKKKKQSATEVAKEINRHTHRKSSAEEKIRIILEGMRSQSI